MPAFDYIARSADGQQVAGVMQADNEAAVLRSLDEKKLFPVQVSMQAAQASRRGKAIRGYDLSLLYTQLADLLRAGVPLMRAMETLANSTTNTRLREMVRLVREDISAGKTLADAMGQRPTAFPSLHCAMVRAGERGGFLEDVLSNLGQFLERQDELQSKVRGAMVYPILLIIIGTMLMAAILIFLVPRFQGFFKNMPLPLPTQLVFGLSSALNDHLLLLLACVAVVAAGLRLAVRSEVCRQWWDRVKIRIPLLGTVLRMVSITRFCRVFGTLLANGVPILQSLAISKDAAGSTTLSASIEQASENVRAGQSLAEPLRKSGLFPAQILEMIAVAEESNQLEKVLVQIADTVERRTNRQVDQAVRLVEPLILVLLAGVIGFLAVGLLYPIFTMSQTFK